MVHFLFVLDSERANEAFWWFTVYFVKEDLNICTYYDRRLIPLCIQMTSLTVWHTHCYPLHVERILSCHGPTLEQLHLCDVTTKVLAPIFSMKRLRTLELRGAKSPLQDFLSYRSPTNNALRLNTLTVTVSSSAMCITRGVPNRWKSVYAGEKVI